MPVGRKGREQSAGGAAHGRCAALSQAKEFGVPEVWMNERLMRCAPDSFAEFLTAFEEPDPKVRTAASCRSSIFKTRHSPLGRPESRFQGSSVPHQVDVLMLLGSQLCRQLVV